MANLELCDKHNMVDYLKKPTGSEEFQEIVDFLNESHIRNSAIVDGKEFTITEASVRRHLQLADVDGISVLPTTKIFTQLSLMGYVLTDDKLTFQKGFSGEQTPLFPSMLAIQADEGEALGHPSEPQPPPSTAQPIHEESIPNIVSSSHQKTQTPRQALHQVTELPQTSEPIPNVPDEAVYEEWDDRVERDTTIAASLDAAQASGNITKTQSMAIPNTRSERVPTTPHDSPLPRVNTLGSDEGSMSLQELTVLYTKLSSKVESFEVDLKQTKQVYGVAYTKLIMKGRMIKEIDQDAGVTLVTPTHSQKDQLEDQLGVFSAAKVLADASKNIHTYTRRRRAISIGSGGVSTASRLFSTAEESVSIAGASMPVSTAGMQRQKRAGYEADVRLQEQLDEEERQRIARMYEETKSFNIEEWENTQATIEADEELAQRIQAEETEKYFEAEKARLLAELINQRKRYITQQRAEERRNKPLTQAQQRTYMSNYIKHMESHTLQQLKRLSFDELKALFKTTMRRVQTFHPIESEGDKTVPELTTGSSKMDAKVELDHKGSKKQKTNEASSTTEPTDNKEKELWVELKRLFEPDSDDTLWKLQMYMHDPLVWRLYDTCGVHHVSLVRGHDIFMLEVDINKKTENQAKMTKLSMEWKRLGRGDGGRAWVVTVNQRMEGSGGAVVGWVCGGGGVGWKGHGVGGSVGAGRLWEVVARWAEWGGGAVEVCFMRLVCCWCVGVLGREWVMGVGLEWGDGRAVWSGVGEVLGGGCGGGARGGGRDSGATVGYREMGWAFGVVGVCWESEGGVGDGGWGCRGGVGIGSCVGSMWGRGMGDWVGSVLWGGGELGVGGGRGGGWGGGVVGVGMEWVVWRGGSWRGVGMESGGGGMGLGEEVGGGCGCGGGMGEGLVCGGDKGNILLVQVYVDDIIVGSTKKSLCVEFEQVMHKRFQMSSMGELTFFLVLQVKHKDDGIFICQDKSMIGSLMYLTASRPDIMFVVCAYARDSPFDLEAFSDSDYAGASLDRKSTTGGVMDPKLDA
ncbi:putative ribonuclease H-like domain-containing protein [Tanacetum coccineum]|uniref:Ribonuclease H-like domain-containing protein n=1 Tax=Tanacetum coccineum TaxID=301880 RepID=A0ABQ5FRN0_9ASTR